MNIIKRLTATIIFLSLSLSCLPSAMVFAADDIREDFEGEKHNFKLITSENSKYEYWNADTSEKNNNSTKIYGIGSGTSDTGAYWTLPEAVSDTVQFSTDIRLDACASGKASTFALLGSHCSKNYLSSNQRILTISGTASGKGVWGTLMLNSTNITDKANVPSANGSESGGKGGVYGDSTGWLRLSATLNFTLQKASIKLTRISDNSTIYEGMQDFIDNTSSLQEIYIAANKTCGGVFLDNISIGKPEFIDNPQIAGAFVNMVSFMQTNSESAITVSRIYDGGGKDISDTAQISYSSSSPDIISINENGVMRKLADGAANITVTINSEGSEPYIYTQTVSDVKNIITTSTGNETVIDTSSLSKGGSVKEFAVITSIKGQAVKQYTTECADSITVDTSGADKAEVIPVFYYDSIKDAKNSVTFADYFPDGRYSFTIKKAAAKCCDIYVNDCMIANNVDQPGYGRNRSSGSEYTARDTKVEGGRVKIQTKDIIESNDNGELSWVKIQREPETITRKKRITIIGDSLVANYYGSGSDVLGSKQTGWGQALSDFISDEYEVINLANSGYYAKNMYDTSFQSVLYHSERDDIFLFEAGYNDEKYSSREEMKTYVLKMVEEAQAAGLETMLVSPDACVEAYTYPVKLGSVMKEAAEEKNVGFIDISLYSYNFLKATYGDDTDAIKKTIGLKYGIGKDDNTHSSYLGAYKYASFVAGGLYKLGYTDMINTEYTYVQTDFKENKIECNALIEPPEYDGSESPSPSPSIEPTPSVSPTDTPTVTPIPKDKITVLEKTYNSGTLSCKFNITKSGRLIVAAYAQNGVLNGVEMQNLEAGDHNISLACSDKANKIKLMLWEDDNMKPIAKAEEFYLSQAMLPHILTPVRAMAVSEQNNDEGYYPASNVIDGLTEGNANGSSYESRWTAATYNVPAWITVDYGSVKELTQFDIWWNTSEGKTNRYSGYEIYVSDDNMNYKKVIDKNNNTTPLHTTDTFPDGTTGRFVKVNITKLSAGWPVVFEMAAQGRDIDMGLDRSRLESALSFCENVDLNVYQDYGIIEYQTALSAAKAVDDNSSQEDIDNAANSLITAKENLRLKGIKDGARTIVNENPDWIFIKEKNSSLGAADISSNPTFEIDLTGFTGISLPHTWNAQDGFDGSGSYDRCKGWYRKNIYIDKSYEGKKIYLSFGGAGTSTELYINGTHIPYGSDTYENGNDIEYAHKGGYSAFEFDITDYVHCGEQNLVAVMCDNTKTTEIAPLDGDFNNQGGLYRDVELIVCDNVHIANDYGADAVYITPKKVTDVNDNENTDFNLTAAAEVVNDSGEDKEVTITAVLRHPDSFDVPDNDYIKQYLRFNPNDMYVKDAQDVKVFETKTVTVKSGERYNYTDTVFVESPHLWNGLADPYQYEVAVSVSVDGKVTEEIVKNIGFRYIDIPRPNSDYSGGGFYLNGKPYVLRGANKHQDYGRGENALGFAVTEKERLNDVGIMYELGMNAVRLAHYQHDEKEIELYDKLGIIVWSELGLVDDMISQTANSYSAFMNVTKYQMTSMVKQLYNHPSIAVWGISNELRREESDNLKTISSTEMSVPSGADLFEQLNNTIKAIDTTRPTTYAAFSLFGRVTDWDSDTFAMNLYPYWYTSHAKQLHGGAASMTDQMHRYFGVPDKDGQLKPMGISEYGASGVIGYTAPYQTDGTVKHPGEASYTTTYQAYCHEKVYNEIVNELPYVWCSFVWQLFDNASFKKGSLLKGTNDKGLVQYDHETKKDAFYFYKANWNDFEPFAYIVASDTKSIVRAYSNAEKLQLYIDGKPFGEPISDTNTADGVADGLGIFMWYDVPDGEVSVEIVD